MDLEKLATSAIEKEIAKTDLLSSFINSGIENRAGMDTYIYMRIKRKQRRILKKSQRKLKVRLFAHAMQNEQFRTP